MPEPLVLVTGGTGFIGSHVISQLLEQGYRVRGTARSTSKLRIIFPDAASEQLEVVEIPTLLSDYTDALKGVWAVVHLASSLFTKGASSEEIFESAYGGTLHIVRQAIVSGVKKVVITGTFASLFDSDFKAAFGTEVVTEKDFGSVTLETFDSKQETMFIYQQAKTLADKKIWKFAREYPDVDFTVILPPAVYGPLVPNYPLTDSACSMGTNVMVYRLLTSGPDNYPPSPVGHRIDVRDAARAHVAALSAPTIPGRDKRFIVSCGTFSMKMIADLVRKERPDMAGGLPREDVVPPVQSSAPLDTTFAKEVLGLCKYIPCEETLLAAVDVVAQWERKNGLRK